MSEFKFALIGKNISHSKSKKIYEELLGKSIHYDLLDIQSSEQLPDLKQLQAVYYGINITSPYKKFYIQQVELTPEANKVGALNCLFFRSGKIHGENTDYLAIKNFFQNVHQGKHFFCQILGDGVMANCTKIVLTEIGLPFRQYSRKSHGDITKLDLSSITSSNQILVINTCSRDYVFQGKLPTSAWFWDYNYDFHPHLNSNFISPEIYLDGLALLKSQAFYALKFWDL